MITLGNSDGFVEPLESSNIMIILSLSSHIIDVMRYENNDDLIKKYNVFANDYFDTIRDFIFMHFAFNKKLDTDYWKDCRSRVGLLQSGIGAELLEYYKTNNANIKFLSHVYRDENPYGLEGWWSLFRGLGI